MVWDTPSGPFDAVYGRRLSGGGTVTTTDAIAISTQADVASVADLVYLPGTGQYYAVWMKGNFGFQNGDVQGRAIMPNGSTGSTVSLAATNRDERQPRLTVDGSGALLVWQKSNVSSGYDLYGQVLDASGLPSGDPFTIQETAGEQQNPAVAYSSNLRYQLAWQDDREGGWDLYTASLDRSYQYVTIQYTYDPLYRLVRADYSGDFDGEYAYAYDAVGNRTAYTTTITGTTVITYQYDAANRLLESVAVGGDTTTYEWDDAGRLITTTMGLNVRRVYTYSQDGDLTAALVDGLLTTFIYDGQGQRLQMSVAGAVVTYTLDYAASSRVLFEEGGAFSDTKHYLYGLACLGEQVDADDAQNSAWRYYQRDGQNLVRQTTNEETAVTLAWTFTPEGAVLLGEEGPVTNLDCSGNAIYDFSTGLIFKNGNYFDPSNGIWITLTGGVVWQATRGDRRERKANRRRRKWLLLFLFLLLMLVLIGCNNNPAPTVPPISCPEPPVLPTNTPGVPTNTPVPMPSPNNNLVLGLSVHIKTVAYIQGSNPQQAIIGDGAGLGTVVDVNKRVILTHNHFGGASGITIDKAQALIIQDSSGNHIQVNNFRPIPIDRGTMLIDLDNNEISFSQQAQLGNPQTIPVGTDYHQVYWSGASMRIFPTTIKENDPQSNVFVLDNPNGFLREGDSGGGGFVNDLLVGNLWSVSNLDNARAAKIPSDISTKIQQAK